MHDLLLDILTHRKRGAKRGDIVSVFYSYGIDISPSDVSKALKKLNEANICWRKGVYWYSTGNEEFIHGLVKTIWKDEFRPSMALGYAPHWVLSDIELFKSHFRLEDFDLT